MKKIKLLSLSVVLFLISCGPQALVRIVEEGMPPWDPEDGFALLHPENNKEVDAKYLGLFALEDSGFTLQCDYATMLNLAKEKAFAAGANVIKVTKVKRPDRYSTCHRIYGRFYYAEDYREYETEIYRSEERKLAVSDFKASYKNKSSAVRSVHEIQVFWERSPTMGYWYFKTKPTFICTDSYYNPNIAEESHLEIENLKFDITEKYARMWIKKMQEAGITTVNEFDKKMGPISNALESDWDKETNEFLFEVQKDPEELKRWKSKLLRDLKDLELFKDKRCLLKV